LAEYNDMLYGGTSGGGRLFEWHRGTGLIRINMV